MKRLAILSILLIVLVAGCTSQGQLECNSPYIKVGNSCCLDTNNNNICDDDESEQGNNLDSSDDSCTGIVCEDYCEGGVSTARYYNGICSNGECSYASQICQTGCRNGSCLEFTIGNGICESGEENENGGCFDCQSTCNNDHTQICYHSSCEQVSITLDSRHFHVPSNWDHVSTVSTQEFMTSGDSALIGIFIDLGTRGYGSVQIWETYLSNIKADTICYTMTGAYALGVGEEYKNITMSEQFQCFDDSDECLISSDGRSIKKLTNLGASTYYPSFSAYTLDDTEKPLTLECKVKIWSEDIPDNIQEDTFKITFK